jgi:large subunit ribosomal protein L19
MKALIRVERDHLKKKVARFSVGDTVKVHVKVMEGDKVRNQIFQGTVIGRRGGGVRETFVVRKISAGVAVERIFPLHSPTVTRIEVVRQGRVRRAQLTYMRTRKGKSARVSGLRGDTADAKAAAKVAAEAAAEDAPEPEPTEDAAEEAAETVES